MSIIRENVGMIPSGDELRECRLRWFSHVRHRPIDALARSIKLDEVKRGRDYLDWGKRIHIILVV